MNERLIILLQKNVILASIFYFIFVRRFVQFSHSCSFCIRRYSPRCKPVKPGHDSALRPRILRVLLTLYWQFSRPARLIFPSGESRPIRNIRTHRMRVETIFVGLPGRRSLSPRVSSSRTLLLSCAGYAGYKVATVCRCFRQNNL